jgi:carbon storage regulator CsrA
MLVLSRGKRESIVIGEEITLTVEEIADQSDGRRIIGASVKLGFQTPRHVSIYRSELCARGTAAGTRPPAAQRPCEQRRESGEIVTLTDAAVRLRIHVPRKVPVCHNGTPTIGQDTEGSETHSPGTVHHVTCHKDDKIAICHNINISALDFYRFVFN